MQIAYLEAVNTVQRLETLCGTGQPIRAIASVNRAAHAKKQLTTSANEVVVLASITNISTVNKEIDGR